MHNLHVHAMSPTLETINMRSTVPILLLAALCLAPGSSSRADEPTRPRPVFHFTPPKNFINDPNGLVFLAGEYHLFYQHNPEGDRWGHMSWGHAVSQDLLRWTHLPIALREQDGIMIFSGSAVFDEDNTSGLGRKDAPPLVAVYTGDGHKKQTQNLASSLDRGRTWTKFAGNPVLDVGSNSFRDPKVFWHAPTSRWIMATVLADERKVRLWGSQDLKAWEKLSDFGPAGATKGVWECPELFQAPLEGAGNGESRWVLKVDVNDGAPFGGSGGQYFVGRFDGKEFRADGMTSDPLWIDHGKDFYAAQTWNDAPGSRPVWIAWMNNWQYANDIPTSPWRGAMTIPRTVALRRTGEGLRIVQAPVETWKTLRGDHRKVEARPIPAGKTKIGDRGIEGSSLEIIAEFEPGDAEEFGLLVRCADDDKEETLIGFDRRAGTMFVDRTRSGAVGFSRDFRGRHSARLSAGEPNGPVRLHVIVDVTSVEVFADDGRAILTDQIFPKASSRGVGLFATGGPARLRSLEAWELRP
jgi:fructan beta-fructosidase